MLKNRLVLSFIVLVPFFISAQDILISDGGTVTVCSGTLVDSGGSGFDYSNNESYMLTICSDEEDGCLQLSFSEFDVEQGYDVLAVYAGPEAAGEPYAELTGTNSPGVVSTGTNCLTLVFTSDGSITGDGFEIEITCVCPTCDDGYQNGDELGVDCGGPDCEPCDDLVIGQSPNLVSTCSNTLYDNGYQGNYLNNSNDQITICSESAGDCLQATFLLFDINSTANDWLFVYGGVDTNAPLVGSFNQGSPPPTTLSPGTDCLTFEFISNGAINSAGFEILLECVCPSCDDGILNGQELAIDCGGPHCPECDFIVMGQTENVSTCGSGIYDNGVAGNYSDNSDDVLTVCADTEEDCINAEFYSFDIEQGYDNLHVFNGASIQDPLIGTYTGSVIPPNINSGGQCLTFHFESDGTVNSAGYEIEVSCQCPSCDDGILNGQELMIDCGGPDCEACDFNSISEGTTVASCDGLLFDSGIADDYGPDEDHIMTFCAESNEQCLVLDFLDVGIAIADHLYIYDGEGIDGELLADITASAGHDSINTLSSCATFHFISNGVGGGSGFEIDISCDCATSLYESGTRKEEQLNVSPNPSEGVIRISNPIDKTSELLVLSKDGRIVFRKALRTSDSLEVDLSNLATGYYQLILINESSFATSSFVKR